MQLVYGTKNTGKIESMQKCLQGLREVELTVIGIGHLGIDVSDVEETGKTPLDNARIKALAYYDAIKRPVFSLDSGLYFDGLPDDLQPGLHVRRVQGRHLDDLQMIEYYSQLAKKHGGELTARYRNGLCLVVNHDLILEHAGDDIATRKFLITSMPHERRVEGFPLDSLSVDAASGEYFFDLYQSNYDKEEAWNTDEGFCRFFRSAVAAMAAST